MHARFCQRIEAGLATLTLDRWTAKGEKGGGFPPFSPTLTARSSRAQRLAALAAPSGPYGDSAMTLTVPALSPAYTKPVVAATARVVPGTST